MSPGMVSDTKAVQTHFTVTLQLFWHGTTMRGIWHLLNIYCTCRTWPRTRVWQITGTAVAKPKSVLAVRPAFTWLFNPIIMTSVSFISMGARGVQVLHFSCVMHVCLSMRQPLSRAASVLLSAHYRILVTHILNTKETFGIISLVGKQSHLVKSTLKYSIKTEQRNGHMDNRLLQTLAKWLQKYKAMVQLSLAWHSAWEQVGFYSPK